jgi:hypothetical protein
MGAGLWLASLNVQYRDFRYVVPFQVQFGLYVSPVGFSSAIVPVEWHLLYALNPTLGDHRPGRFQQPAGVLVVDGDRGPAADHRHPPVPADGEAVSGCDLTAECM